MLFVFGFQCTSVVLFLDLETTSVQLILDIEATLAYFILLARCIDGGVGVQLTQSFDNSVAALLCCKKLRDLILLKLKSRSELGYLISLSRMMLQSS